MTIRIRQPRECELGKITARQVGPADKLPQSEVFYGR